MGFYITEIKKNQGGTINDSGKNNSEKATNCHFGVRNIHKPTVYIGFQSNELNFLSRRIYLKQQAHYSISSPISFHRSLMKYEQIGDKQSCSDFVYRYLTNLLLSKRFTEVDEILSYESQILSTPDILISILSVTKPFKDHLKKRMLLLESSVVKIKEIYNAESAERILRRIS